MSKMVGTIIDIKSLYGSSATEILFRNGTESKRLISLKEQRIYKIPYFQREIRWTKENLITLINDIEKNHKFLGNFIFTQDFDGNYDILDGQQRTTIILMLIQYIRKMYGERISVFETCELQINSFLGFRRLFLNYFDMSSIEKTDAHKIKQSDDYKQMKKYLDLWKEIGECNIFSNVADAESFLRNLERCEVNVIINTDNAEQSIENFLDVNLKGVKLDTEDIFKAYLCAQDNSEEIHKIWSEIKKINADIEASRKNVYPFMMILEHYFQCVLLRDNVYKEMDFNSEFELKSARLIEGKKYSAGEHIVKVIHNQAYLRNCLNELKDLMEVIKNIIIEKNLTTYFHKFFDVYNADERNKNKKIDEDEIAVIYNLIRKILLDKNRAPKCLVVLYILDVLNDGTKNKEMYRAIYGIFVVSVMFGLYEPKKENEIIYKIVRQDNWYTAAVQHVNGYFERGELSNRQIIAKYKYAQTKSVTENNEIQKFRCKSMATIYNFLNITKNRISVKKHMLKGLKSFLEDSDKYSVEHFILNESGKCNVKIAGGIVVIYEYPEEIKKYKDSLFNYIFISQQNNNELDNEIISEKINMIHGDLEEAFRTETCKYSQRVIALVEDILMTPDCSTFSDEEEVKQELDRYYKVDFKNRFAEYAGKIIQTMTDGV